MYTLYLKCSSSVSLKLHFCINQYPKKCQYGGKRGDRLLDLVHVNNILMINFARRGELSFRVSPCTSYGSWCGDAYFQRSQIITHWPQLEYISSFERTLNTLVHLWYWSSLQHDVKSKKNGKTQTPQDRQENTVRARRVVTEPFFFLPGFSFDFVNVEYTCI